MRQSIRAGSGFVIVVLASMILGCGKNGPDQPEKTTHPDKGKTDKQGSNSVDFTDAESVALAFIKSIAAKDGEEAIKYVNPAEHAAIKEAFKKGFPPFPTDPRVHVVVKDDHADVDILNAKGFGLDMCKIQGKWYITK